MEDLAAKRGIHPATIAIWKRPSIEVWRRLLSGANEAAKAAGSRF